MHAGGVRGGSADDIRRPRGGRKAAEQFLRRKHGRGLCLYPCSASVLESRSPRTRVTPATGASCGVRREDRCRARAGGLVRVLREAAVRVGGAVHTVVCWLHLFPVGNWLYWVTEGDCCRVGPHSCVAGVPWCSAGGTFLVYLFGL